MAEIQVTWRQFWSQLKDFLGNLPSTVRRDLGDLQALLSLVCDHDMQSRIEAAVQARYKGGCCYLAGLLRDEASMYLLRCAVLAGHL